jgi:Papain family cysteine protease
MEGLNAILNNQLISLSEQQILDCSYEYGNFGCDGEVMTRTLEDTAAKGLEPLSDYTYTAKNSIFCKYNKSEVVFHNTSQTNVPPKNVTQLMTAVVQQTISVAVQADQAAWQHYQSGIVTSNCVIMLDHGVLVGYGTSV